MPLHIGRVDATVDIARAVDPAQTGPPPAPAPSGAAMDIESLRSMVLQILREELESVQRRQG